MDKIVAKEMPSVEALWDHARLSPEVKAQMERLDQVVNPSRVELQDG